MMTAFSIPITLKISNRILAVITFFSLLITSCFYAKPPSLSELPQEAFTTELDKQLPMDPKVITGELGNGLHYYIRKNTEPKNRAELRLVINAGSILEDEKQLGLAHFVEHMAFQGTEHFEKQKILEYMKSIGMKIGSGINAFTGPEETYYMLQIPTDDKSCLGRFIGGLVKRAIASSILLA